MKGKFIFVSMAALLLSFTAFAQKNPVMTPAPEPQPSAAVATGAESLLVPSFEVGGGFTTLVISNDTRAGFGFRGVRNLNPSLSLEGEFNWSLENPLFREEGGQMLEGLFGIKAGHRGKRAGLFAKARPGFISFTDVGATHGALDLGGVVEFYPSTHWLVRGDIGDTMVLAGGAGTQLHNAQFGVSVHYRF